MKVTKITVNAGQLPRAVGFVNGRLDNTLGLQDKGMGQRFAYAFQIAFDLEGVSGNDVKVTRRVQHQTQYPFNNKPTPQQVIEQYKLAALRNSSSYKSEDSPNAGNIVRSENRIIVQDGPGPSMLIGDKKMYPMCFEGKFILILKSPDDQVMASVEYYVRLLKETVDGTVPNGKLHGEFDEMHHTITLPHPVRA